MRLLMFCLVLVLLTQVLYLVSSKWRLTQLLLNSLIAILSQLGQILSLTFILSNKPKEVKVILLPSLSLVIFIHRLYMLVVYLFKLYSPQTATADGERKSVTSPSEIHVRPINYLKLAVSLTFLPTERSVFHRIKTNTR